MKIGTDRRWKGQSPCDSLPGWIASGVAQVEARGSADQRRLTIRLLFLSQHAHGLVVLTPLDRDRSPLSGFPPQTLPYKTTEYRRCAAPSLVSHTVSTGLRPQAEGTVDIPIDASLRRASRYVSVTVLPSVASLPNESTIRELVNGGSGFRIERRKQDLGLGLKPKHCPECLLTRQPAINERLEWIVTRFRLANDGDEARAAAIDRVLHRMLGGYATAFLRRADDCETRQAIRQEIEKVTASAIKHASAESRRRRGTRHNLVSRGHQVVAATEVDLAAISDPGSAACDQESDTLNSARLETAIRHLVECSRSPQRFAFMVEHLAFGRNLRELAEEMGLEYSTARSIASRVKKRLGIAAMAETSG